MSGFVLGLDCSAQTYSAGLLGPSGEKIEISGYKPRRALRELPAAIAHLLRSQGTTYQQLEVVGVTEGPGSFTGVRLGVTLALTVARTAQAKLVGLDTLRVLAHGRQSTAVALDARRGEVYCGAFDGEQTLIPTDVRTPGSFLELLKPLQVARLVGSGFQAYPDMVPQPWTGPVPGDCVPQGLVVAEMARMEADRQDNLGHDLRPQYYRRADIQVSGQP